LVAWLSVVREVFCPVLAAYFLRMLVRAWMRAQARVTFAGSSPRPEFCSSFVVSHILPSPTPGLTESRKVRQRGFKVTFQPPTARGPAELQDQGGVRDGSGFQVFHWAGIAAAGH
jgi:hypothetical protein